MSNIRPGSFGDAPQPPEPGSLLPAPRPSGGALGFVKAAPLWAKLAAPIAAVIIVAGIAGASGSGKKSAAIAAASSTTVQSTTTTEPRTSVAPTTVPPATAPRATAPPARVPPTVPRTTPPTPPPTQGGPGNPGDSKNCSDFATYAQAKAWFDTYFPRYGDVAHLDADGDGIPCESLPGAP